MSARFAGLMVAASVLLVGCTVIGQQPNETPGSTMQNEAADKAGTGELRTDSAPLTDRFPALVGLESANWMSGTLGSERVPGPSLYWIDAVVVLTPSDFDALRDGYDLTAATSAPAVHPGLASIVPSELLSSAELDAEFSKDQYQSSVYLAPDQHALVLVTIFE